MNAAQRSIQKLWSFRTLLEWGGGPRVWIAIYIARALLISPTSLAAEKGEVVASTKSQQLVVDDVLIEGKLYSPQALFIVSRDQEEFGRDSVVPHYLMFSPSTRPVPYRLRRDVLQTLFDEELKADASSEATPRMDVDTTKDPRRSP